MALGTSLSLLKHFPMLVESEWKVFLKLDNRNAFTSTSYENDPL